MKLRINATILIPADQANTWCVSDQLGIVESLDVGNFDILGVLVEKNIPGGPPHCPAINLMDAGC